MIGLLVHLVSSGVIDGNLGYTNNAQEVNRHNETFRSSRPTQRFMEARYMVSYFARNHFDYDVEDVSNCPLAAHLTVIADSPDECGFKSTLSVKFT